MNQKWRLIALWLLPIGMVIILAWQVFGSAGLNNQLKSEDTSIVTRNTAVSRMSYGRFIDYIDAGRVTSVDIYEGGRNAVVEAVDPELDNRVQRIRVELPGLAPELINTLKEDCLLYTSPSPRDLSTSRMPSSA